MSLWHGQRGDASWAQPKCVVESSELARPGYDTVDASEYLDEPEVLEAKVSLLAELVAGSTELCAYTGAGLSTAAGIGDYASRAAGSLAKGRLHCGAVGTRQLKPTLAHRVLATLGRRGTLKHWVQQNHDGLAQKAGCPPELVNELHGGWFDPKNPVVKMSGSLRDDLYDRFEQTAAVADCVLALGTSLSGLAADGVAVSCARRAARGAALGLVVVSLQRTRQDPAAALRIFARLDDVLGLLARKLAVAPTTDEEVAAASAKPQQWYSYMYSPPPARPYPYKPETEAKMRKRAGHPPKKPILPKVAAPCSSKVTAPAPRSSASKASPKTAGSKVGAPAR